MAYFALISKVGSPNTPPVVNFTSDVQQILSTLPEVVLCMQSDETLQGFNYRVECVVEYMTER